MNPLGFLGSLVFKAIVLRQGVHWLSEPDNPKLKHATWWSVASVVAVLTTFDIAARILGAIFPFALPLYWLLLLVTYLLVFGAYYGLGPWRWMWTFPLLAITDRVWNLIARILGL